MKQTLSPNCCYCEQPHGKSSPSIFQPCDACQDEWHKREIDASKGLTTVSCPRCDLLFSADATNTLTDAERRAVEAATRIIDAYEEEMDGFPSGAAVTLRGLLERTGGER